MGQQGPEKPVARCAATSLALAERRSASPRSVLPRQAMPSPQPAATTTTTPTPSPSHSAAPQPPPRSPRQVAPPTDLASTPSSQPFAIPLPRSRATQLSPSEPLPVGTIIEIHWRPKDGPEAITIWAGTVTSPGKVEYSREHRQQSWGHIYNTKQQPITRAGFWPPPLALEVRHCQRLVALPSVEHDQPVHTPSKQHCRNQLQFLNRENQHRTNICEEYDGWVAKTMQAMRLARKKTDTARSTARSTARTSAKATMKTLQPPRTAEEREQQLRAGICKEHERWVISTTKAMLKLQAKATPKPTAHSAMPMPQPPPTTEQQQTQGSDLFDIFEDQTDPIAHLGEDDEDDDVDADDEPDDVAARLTSLAAPVVDESVLAAFQKGHACPAVTLMTGADLVNALRLPPAQPSKLIEAGVNKETRATHRRLLKTLSSMTAPYRAMHISTAISEWLEHRRKQCHWRQVTRMKYMCSTQGAIASLPLYKHGALPIQISSCPSWRAAMRTCARAARTEIPRQPMPATFAAVCKAAALEPQLQVRVAMLIAWMVAGRVGDCLRLLTKDVTMSNNCLTITYRHHKTNNHKGPYSVTSAPLAPDHASLVQRWLGNRRSSTFLFPQPKPTGVAVRVALRRADAKLEQRSLRRGALLTMAAAGVCEATLMEFSGHTTVAMLRRYLAWGTAAKHTTDATRAAAAALTVIRA